MDRTNALKVIGEYAADQWGMIMSRQASELGVARTTLTRLVDAGLLESVARGVYMIVAASAAATHLRERAAWLRLAPGRPAWERRPLDDDGGVLSHRSAAQVHGLGDLLASQVEFTVPRRRVTRDSQVRFHIGQLGSDDVTTIDGLPVTTVERTIVDLLAARVDGGHIGDVLADALRRNLVQIDVLAPRVGQYAGRYGVRGRDGRRLLDSLLAQVGYTEPQDQRQRQVRDIAEVVASLDRAHLVALREFAMAAQRIPSPLADFTAHQQALLKKMQFYEQLVGKENPALLQVEHVRRMIEKLNRSLSDSVTAAYSSLRTEEMAALEERDAGAPDNGAGDPVAEKERER